MPINDNTMLASLIGGAGALGMGYNLTNIGAPYPNKTQRAQLALMSQRLQSGEDPNSILQELSALESGVPKTASAVSDTTPLLTSLATAGGIGLAAGYPAAYIHAKSRDIDRTKHVRDLTKDWEGHRKEMSDRMRKSILETHGISEEELAEEMEAMGKTSSVGPLSPRNAFLASTAAATGLGTAAYLTGKKVTDDGDKNDKALKDFARVLEESAIHSSQRPSEPLSGVLSPDEILALDNIRRKGPGRKRKEISADPSNPELQNLLSSV
jgi:hypothetical protein